MKKFIVYDHNGEILRTGVCPNSMLRLQGKNVIEGEANDIEHKIVEKKIIRKTDEEIAVIKEKMKPDPQEQIIQKKEKEILRRLAIEELKKEGKL